MMLVVDIKKRLGAFALDAHFEAQSGVTVVFGRSGSGKSSLLKCISGLIAPDEGEISLSGERLYGPEHSVPVHKRGIACVFQEPRLFPHMTVEKNLIYGAQRRGRMQEGEARDVIAMLGIEALLQRRPAKLSGGEQARVALGRALLARPRLLLCDEPLAALDVPRKAELLPYFERLRDRADFPILYVTHATSELARLADRVIVLRDGQIVRQSSGAEALADPLVMPGGVRGVGAVLEARVACHHDDGLTELNAGDAALFIPKISAQIGASLKLRIAAQDVILARRRPEEISALNVIAGTIAAIRRGSGPGALVSLTTGAGTLQARITQRSLDALGLAEGMALYAIVKTVSLAPEDIGAQTS